MCEGTLKIFKMLTWRHSILSFIHLVHLHLLLTYIGKSGSIILRYSNFGNIPHSPDYSFNHHVHCAPRHLLPSRFLANTIYAGLQSSILATHPLYPPGFVNFLDAELAVECSELAVYSSETHAVFP